MKKALFIIIILVSLVLIGGSCDNNETTYKTKPGLTKPGLVSQYDEYDCGDFENWEEAQEVYQYYGGIENDIHHLDRDHDNIPCEALR